MSAPSVADLEALAAFARKHGLRHLKAGDVEMDFHAPSEPIDVARAKELTDAFMSGQPSDEDMLYWSSWQPVKAAEGVGDGEA